MKPRKSSKHVAVVKKSKRPLGAVIPRKPRTSIQHVPKKSIAKNIEPSTELQQSLSLLKGVLESTIDGILVTDLDGRVIQSNQNFADLWNLTGESAKEWSFKKGAFHPIPGSPSLVAILDKVPDPELYVSRVNELYQKLEGTSFDLILLKDNRVFERFSHPLNIAGKMVGRVWSFRDVSERKLNEEKLKDQVLELQRWQKVTLGREGRIQELKQEVNQLLARLGEPVRYPSVESQEPDV
jgi:transcriptional regulator with PAS, ATPase and Fis domain